MMDKLADTLTIFGNNLPLGIALFDRDQQMQRCNRTWSRYIDYAEAPTHTTLAAILPSSYAGLAPLIVRVLKGERVEQEAMPIVVQNDVLFWDITLTPQMVDGEVRGFVLIANDVTERHLAQQLLERRVSDRTRKLTALYDIMAVATEAWNQPLDAVLHACLEKVMSATHASGGAIQLLDETGEQLHLHAHIGLDAELVEQIEVTSADSGLPGWTATHDDELVLKDVNSDQRTTDVLRQSEVNVYAGAPMTVQGRVIGVVSVFRERRRSFGADDIALLSSVADQVASVVAQREVLAANEHLLLVQERNRLARELHDAVTQSLYSLMLFAGASKRQLQNGNLANALHFTTQLEGTAQQALKEMRLLLHNLRPAILAEVGLVRALRQRLDAVEARAGITASLRADEIELSPNIEEAIYFIASEALNNALKHAHATTVQITLQQSSDGVTLTISDNGIGFDPTALRDSGGLGLASMHERSEKLDAELVLISAENQGTTITLTLPSNLPFATCHVP